jgi:phospho-N-acetylmuramoyl-pentapeptide-transferase
METIIILKILLPALVTFAIGILITPIVTHYLYRYKAWKKEGGKTDMLGQAATEFNRLKATHETKTPRMGGIVIWGSVLIAVGILFLLKTFTDIQFFTDVFFLSRSQTWIPFTTFFIGAAFGLLNDFYDIQHGGKGVRLSVRLILISLLAAGIGWWFYTKLGVTTIGIPFGEPLYLGILIIPFFILLTNAVYASGVIDGIDGLSGGVFGTVFAAYAGVAILQSQYDLAAFCIMIVGAILAFLWFNIPPARFWMTETGSMPLTLTLAVILLMTDQLVGGYGIALFLIIGFVLIITVLSNIIQISYRKFTGQKFFRIAPLHHHFEAVGWPSYKVTMRYWVISMLCAITGLIIAVILV